MSASPRSARGATGAVPDAIARALLPDDAERARLFDLARAGNALARALSAPVFTSPARPVNPARITFLDPVAAGFYPDWDAVAGQNVATRRAAAGRNPCDKALSDLIGELSTRGGTFRQRWARHQVRRHRAGAKRLNHPAAGPMTFSYETMEPAADEGLYLIVCGAAPGSRDADALSQCQLVKALPGRPASCSPAGRWTAH